MMLRLLNWRGCWVYRIKHGHHCRCERNFGLWRVSGKNGWQRVCGGCGRVQVL